MDRRSLQPELMPLAGAISPSGAGDRPRAFAQPHPRRDCSAVRVPARSNPRVRATATTSRRNGQIRGPAGLPGEQGRAMAAEWPDAGDAGPQAGQDPNRARSTPQPGPRGQMPPTAVPPPSAPVPTQRAHWPSVAPSSTRLGSPSSASSAVPTTVTSFPKVQSPITLSRVAFRSEGASGMRAVKPSTFL